MAWWPWSIILKEIRFPILPSTDLIRLEPLPGKELPPLQIGQILKGEVREVIDERHALIRLEGQDLVVESRIPLDRGMVDRFQVTSLSPQIVLKLLPTDRGTLTEAEKRLWAFLMSDPFGEKGLERLTLISNLGREGFPPPVRETITRLMNLWTSFFPSRSFTIDPGQIEKMVIQSGLFFEHLLGKVIETGRFNRLEEVLDRDVKGLLLKWKGQLEATSSQNASFKKEGILEGLDHLLRRIEGYQLLHALAPDEAEKDLFLLLPFWIQGRLQLVDLHLSLPHSGSGGSETGGLSMLFLLHMPEWGRMSIEVRWTGKKLYGRFLFSRDEVTSFFNRELYELQKGLLRLGFPSEMHASTQAPEKIVEHFTSAAKGKEKSLLNLVV